LKVMACSFAYSSQMVNRVRIARQQRRGARFHDHVPITPIVRPTLPFVTAHADCIGPLDPKSSEGHEYCLTIVDSCTRWPTVYLLKSINATKILLIFINIQVFIR
jgi:hypothetical protein